MMGRWIPSCFAPDCSLAQRPMHTYEVVRVPTWRRGRRGRDVNRAGSSTCLIPPTLLVAAADVPRLAPSHHQGQVWERGGPWDLLTTAMSASQLRNVTCPLLRALWRTGIASSRPLAEHASISVDAGYARQPKIAPPWDQDPVPDGSALAPQARRTKFIAYS